MSLWPSLSVQKIVYVVDKKKKKEVTCYATPVNLKCVKISDDARQTREDAIQVLATHPSCWKSNTVLMIDTSGSMRKSDIWGARCRLDAVWLSIALDFVAHRLEAGNAGHYDVISIVLMGDVPEVLIREQPTSWMLYNEIVDIYEKKTVKPFGHGRYASSLECTQTLLTKNSCASCALAVCLFSDGRPTDDNQGIAQTVETLAKQFGRRLNFTAVGIGASAEDFEMLKGLAETAKDFGAQASFELPSMSSSALGDVLTLTATSLTRTQTEMTDLTSMKQKMVRDVQRESRTRASEKVESVSDDQYWFYPLESVTRRVYREWYDKDRKRQTSYDVAPMQHPDAKFIAFNKAAFGEGAERFAYRFFEVADDRATVVGKPLVAKESRLVLEDELNEESLESEKEYKMRIKFVRTFCQTQQLARRIADEFNKRLESLNRVSDATPRVSFLDCSVYDLDDKNMGKQSVLVEEKLPHKSWQKWNANNGYVAGMEKAPEFNHDKMRSALEHLTNIDLDEIEEGSEEEDEDSDSSFDNHRIGYKCKPVPKDFTAFEVAQAFSHFSYCATGKKRLICDLQGVFDEKENMLKLSDPVIHYHNPRKLDRNKVHGRSDLGRSGAAMFFDTHKDCCGHLCRLVTGGFRKVPRKRYGRY